MEDILDDNRDNIKNKDPQPIVSLAVWLLVVLIGPVFRVLNWPGGLFLTIVFTGGFSGYVVSYFIRLKGKSRINKILLGVVSAWFIFLVLGLWIDHPFSVNQKGIIIYIACFIGNLLILEYVRKFNQVVKDNKFTK